MPGDATRMCLVAPGGCILVKLSDLSQARVTPHRLETPQSSERGAGSCLVRFDGDCEPGRPAKNNENTERNPEMMQTTQHTFPHLMTLLRNGRARRTRGSHEWHGAGKAGGPSGRKETMLNQCYDQDCHLASHKANEQHHQQGRDGIGRHQEWHVQNDSTPQYSRQHHSRATTPNSRRKLTSWPGPPCHPPPAF